MGVSEQELEGFSPNLYRYIRADYSHQPLHPTYGKVRRKKRTIKILKKRKK